MLFETSSYGHARLFKYLHGEKKGTEKKNKNLKIFSSKLVNYLNLKIIPLMQTYKT